MIHVTDCMTKVTHFRVNSSCDHRCWQNMPGTQRHDHFVTWMPLELSLTRISLSCPLGFFAHQLTLFYISMAIWGVTTTAVTTRCSTVADWCTATPSPTLPLNFIPLHRLCRPQYREILLKSSMNLRWHRCSYSIFPSNLVSSKAIRFVLNWRKCLHKYRIIQIRFPVVGTPCSNCAG